jgi:hypothetical protein
MRGTLVWRGAATVIAGLVLVVVARGAWAYDRYNSGCQSCHGAFTASGYTSRATGAAWPSSLHQVHRSSSFMGSDCNLCHLSGDNDNPYTYQSDGTGYNVGYGCIGCHGTPGPGGTLDGSGLRRHHTLAGESACANPACHNDGPIASQESASAPYYGTPDTNVAAPCDDDAGTTEDWNDDGQGLDNDADLIYDGDDPGCQAGFLFHDGFVSGDDSSWAMMMPAH